MSRTFSAAALREMLAQESGEVFLQLLTITHPSITTLRVVNDLQDVTSRGDLFTAFPFQLDLPADATERLPVAQLRLSNVDRRLVDEVRSISGPMTAMLEIVTATTPDTVEIGPFSFDVTSVSFDKDSLVATLAYEPILSEPFPADSFDPQRFPGLFAGG